MSSISSASAATDPYQATNLGAFVQFVNNFNAIGNALQSGDVSDAQNALAQFQQLNLPSTGASASSTTQPFGNNTQANTDFKNLATALQTGDLTGARSAYASLQNDLQGTAAGKTRRHHHHAAENPDATTAPTPSADTAADSLLDVTA